ncbi:MAG: hypothetical protein AAF490_20610 [Chloroflexota bacterium]
MGYSKWNNNAYQSRQTHRKQTNQSAFTYDQHVRSSGVIQVHDDMNPYGKVRESRDSVDHPTSLSIGVLFDVTGSMGTVPRVLQTKLGSLMRLLIQKGYVEHPQVLFGAIGDAYTDRVPLQIGQFESGIEMDDDLGKIFLEGNGGGQVHETYELGMYFMAHNTSIDCYEKRGKKGYLFTIGDEKPYKVVRKDHIQQHIGGAVEQDVPIQQVVEAVQEKYEYFHIIPANTYHGKKSEVQNVWRDLLGERVLLLEDETAVCETIALAIGLCEGVVDDLYDGVTDLVDAGYDANSAQTASSALKTYAKNRQPVLSMGKGRLAATAVSDDDGRL